MPDDRARTADRAHTAEPTRLGLFENLGKTVQDAGQLVVDHLELAALEAQYAANGFVRVLIAAIVVTMLVVAAWMAVVAGGAIFATRAGISLPWALVLAGGVNLLAALAIGAWIRSRVPTLLFAATLRQLHTSKEALTDGHPDD